MNELTRLLQDDMKPALGVTEPAAIALACAKARAMSEEDVVSVVVRVNSGIYKNAFTCGIPGSDLVGNDMSAALGTVCGDPERGLCVLEGISKEAIAAAQTMVDEKRVHVEIDSISSVLLIEATVKTEHDTCIARLQGAHTNFCHLEKNGTVLFHKDFSAGEENKSPITNYSVEQILSYVSSVPVEEIQFIEEAYTVNGALAEAGMQWDRCTITASNVMANGGIFSQDERQSAKTYAGAAAEARVLGTDKAAMSITGSGTHGIICTLPLAAYCKCRNLPREQLLRATALSFLITMYIKEFSGKLSAFCGCGVAGGTGLACALCYLKGGRLPQMEQAINNMAASITGMICTGGNHCCALKVMAAVDAAFNAACLSMDGVGIQAPHGICADTAEKTMHNMGYIAVPGMVGTEEVIVDIMRGSGSQKVHS